MKNLMKKATAIILAVIMIMSMSACQKGDVKSDYAIDTLVIGTTTKIETATRNEYNYNVITGMLSNLGIVRVNEKGEFVPNLTTASTTDSKTYKFVIQEGAKWHDGQPVTAEDIAFTMEYYAHIPDAGFTVKYKNVKVVDERTLEVELFEKNSRHLTALTSLRLIPKHIYKDIPYEDYDTTKGTAATIGNGPYKFEAFDQDAGTLSFTAYEDYFLGKPNVRRVVFKLFDSLDTMYLALESKQVDIVYNYAKGVDPSVVTALEENDFIKITNVNSASNPSTVVFNTTKSPFNNEDLRKAIAFAIDYDNIRTTFGSSGAVASAGGFVPPATLGYTETTKMQRDLAKSREYFEKAGLTDSDNDGFYDVKGKAVEYEILVRSDNALQMRYAEMLKINIEEAGVKIKVVAKDTATYKQISQYESAHQMVIVNMTAYGMAKNAGLGSLYLNGNEMMTVGQHSYARVMDKDFLEIIDKMNLANNQEEYIKYAKELQGYYEKSMPAVALYWDVLPQAHLSSLSGFQIDGTYGLLNVATWYTIEKK